MPTLAQFVNNEQVENQVLRWGAILIGVVIVGFIVIYIVKRTLMKQGNPSGPDAGFSLSDLRAMRDRGEITPDEYEQTRARVIAKVKGKKAAALKEEEEQQEEVDPGEPLGPEEGESGEPGDNASGGDSEG